MLRMTPLASAIVALLLGIEAYAAEETFDTHFMIGGMKDQQVANIRLDDNQPLPGQYDIDIYVNKQWRGKYEIIVKDNPQETCLSREIGNDSNLLIVFYVQIMPDDLVMQLHRF